MPASLLNAPILVVVTLTFYSFSVFHSFFLYLFITQRKKSNRSHTNIRYNKLSTDAGVGDLQRKKTLSVPADDDSIPINQTIPYRDDIDDDDEDADSINESQNHQISFYT